MTDKQVSFIHSASSQESLFPLEYYAQVQGTIESMLASANQADGVDTIDDAFSVLAHFLNLKHGRLYVYDPELNQLVAKCGSTLDLEALGRGHYTPGEGVTGQAFLERQGLYVKDIGHEPLYLGRSCKAQDLPYRKPAYLAVPFYGAHLSGVVGFHLNERGRFDVISTMAIVSLVAEWIARADLLSSAVAA